MAPNNWSSEEQGSTAAENSEVVVGLFQSGEDAHQAILQLQSEGFSASQIGAAFRSEGSSSREFSGGQNTGGAGASGSMSQAGKEIGGNRNAGTVAAGSGAAGAASDTSTVTATGLSPGSGTPRTGIGRLIPEIPTNAIHQTESAPIQSSAEIPGASSVMPPAVSPMQSGTSSAGLPMADTEAGVREMGSAYSQRSEGFLEGDTSGEHTHHAGGWWEKLKHVFGAGDDEGRSSSSDPVLSTERDREAESKKFGTGEGHLNLGEPTSAMTPGSSDFEYSGLQFENSFSSMGIPAERARFLAREIGRGGAIVTVMAGLRVTEAERVLEQNHARIRHEEALEGNSGYSESESGSGRVELFGSLLRSYREQDKTPDYTNRRAS